MTAAGAPKTTWLLLGRKAGDNAQLRCLAATLPFNIQEKKLQYRRCELLLGRLFGQSLLGIQRAQSDPLQAPWPDLVLTAGRRNEAVARYLKKQSGGHSKIVHLGRPWAHPRHFDLVVTTPQYELPDLANVCEIPLPLHSVQPALADSLENRKLREELLVLNSPRIAVLVGGHAGEFRLSAAVADEFGEQLLHLVETTGGQLMVVASPRTPPQLLDHLRTKLPPETWFSAFQADATHNPYPVILATADRFVVTADSVSMMTEALSQNRVVQVFDSRLKSSSLKVWTHGWRPLMQRLSERLAAKRFHRDIMRIHQRLRAAGRISFLNEPAPKDLSAKHEGAEDLQRVAALVRSLFDSPGGAKP